MDMAVVKFRQLIDMAIGSPEPGHVNFFALHCLLNCIAEKLNIIDENIDYPKFAAVTMTCSAARRSHHDLGRLMASVPRLTAGADPEDNIEEAVVVNAIEEKAESNKGEATGHTEVLPEPVPERPEPPEVIDVMPTIEVVPHEPDEKPPLVESSSKSSGISVHVLDDRISRIESAIEKLAVPDSLISGVAVMKDQLELSIDQLLLLTVLTLSKQPDAKRVQQLYTLAQGLRSIRSAIVFIEKSNRLDLHDLGSIEWRSSELQLNEAVSEEGILEAHNTGTKDNKTTNPANRFDLSGCLCYSPEKMLDELMQLKGDFCLLTNKVNELSARLLKQESQQTIALIHELQEHVTELKLASTTYKEVIERLQTRVTSNVQTLEDLKRNVEEIIEGKVDKTELNIILADKVDYIQLQRKVSLDQMLEVQCRIDKKFCEVFRQISDIEKRCERLIEDLKNTLGFAAIEGILNTFKEQTAKEIHALHHLLQKYIELTNDECAAAGARVKVLPDMTCLSCDTTCVMRSMEKSKVGKLPNARATDSLSPLITYELGSIRKSGLMGYYRKDEFPHATDAWMKRQETGETSRHAGGSHTTSTARERVDKILLNKN